MNFVATLFSRRFAGPYCHCGWTTLLLGLLLFSVATLAQGSSPNFATSLSRSAASDFAIADFDGDQQADIATVRTAQIESNQSRYSIYVQFSTGARQSFGLTAPVGGIRLDSRDVNGDHLTDLVVSTTWSGQPVAILLNDGRGNFVLTGPEEFPGALLETRNQWSEPFAQTPDVSTIPPSRVVPKALASSVSAGLYSDSRQPLFTDPAGARSLSRMFLPAGRAPPNRSHLP
jgi:hypothetical protein